MLSLFGSSNVSNLPAVDAKSAFVEQTNASQHVLENKKNLNGPSQGGLRVPNSLRQVKKKMNSIQMILPTSFTYSNSAANLVTGSINIDVSAVSEWASLQALYDEYRFDGAVVKFQTLVASSGTTSDTMLVLAYDPTDSTVLNSTRAGCELSRHKLFALPNVAGASGVICDGKPLTYSFSCSKNEAFAISSTGSLNYLPGAWKSLPNAGFNGAPDGCLKIHWANGGAISVPVVTGIFYYRVSFRSRN